jgi:integrase
MAPAAPSSAALRGDADVDRWYRNLARGSASTADINLRRLAAFCTQAGTTPGALVKLPEKTLHNALLDFVSAEETRGMAGSYVVRTVKAVKSWLAHNGIVYARRIKVKGSQETPTLKDERTPTQDELRLIFLGANPRTRLCAALMAHSGVRPEVLGNYRGVDGLRLADLPELRIRKDTIDIETQPTPIRVRSELSKNANGYVTFLSTEGCGYLKSYLEERLRSGEQLGPTSDLIHPDRARKQFIRALNIGDGIRAAIRAAGFGWRPYVLRSYFDTQILLAESKGKVTHSYRVYWMGHTGSIDARYTTNKARLPKDLVEDMRAAYARCEPFLSTVPAKGETEAQAKMAKLMLMGLGYSEEDLANLDFDQLDVATFRDLVAKKVRRDASAETARQLLVDSTQLPRYLSDGWRVVTAVNGHQVVIDPPGRS